MTYWDELHGGKERQGFGNWTGNGTCGLGSLKRVGGCMGTGLKREELRGGTMKLYNRKFHHLYCSSDMIM
jgi:hypothetical protein